MRKLVFSALAASSSLIIPSVVSEAEAPNYFAEAAHIPPEACEEEIRHALGSRALEALYIDKELSEKADTKTSVENRAEAKKLPPLPDGTPSLNRYIRENTRPQEVVLLPESGIHLNVSSNIDLEPIDAASLEESIKNTFAITDTSNPLRNAVYECLDKETFENDTLEGRVINVVFLDGIEIRDRLAVDVNIGEGTVGGRHWADSNTVIVCGNGDPAHTNRRFFHELKHALDDAYDTVPDDLKRSEFSGRSFGMSANELFLDNPTAIFVPRHESDYLGLLAIAD